MYVSLTTTFTKKVSLHGMKIISYATVNQQCIAHYLPITLFPFLLVFMEIVSEESRYALQDHLHLITAPLQIIWGKQDQVGTVCCSVNVRP